MALGYLALNSRITFSGIFSGTGLECKSSLSLQDVIRTKLPVSKMWHNDKILFIINCFWVDNRFALKNKTVEPIFSRYKEIGQIGKETGIFFKLNDFSEIYILKRVHLEHMDIKNGLRRAQPLLTLNLIL